MSYVEPKARRLVIGVGNPSRGDDAVGPLAVERLEALDLPDLELLTDFQLQVEYLLDMADRDLVIFVDATVDPQVREFAFFSIRAELDNSFSSHELSPQAVLAAFERHYRAPPPPSYVLAIRGHGFELGAGLSPAAAAGLTAALAYLVQRLR